jgi:hypothetical protein
MDHAGHKEALPIALPLDSTASEATKNWEFENTNVYSVAREI